MFQGLILFGPDPHRNLSLVNLNVVSYGALEEQPVVYYIYI